MEADAGRPANHDMLAAYESVWVLGLAMMHTQSSDPGRLAETIYPMRPQGMPGPRAHGSGCQRGSGGRLV